MTAIENQWISFFEKQPEDGQGIWYYGHNIEVGCGEYCSSPGDPAELQVIIKHESLGFIDRLTAPWWMVDDGVMDRPTKKPSRPVPPDYPSG